MRKTALFLALIVILQMFGITVFADGIDETVGNISFVGDSGETIRAFPNTSKEQKIYAEVSVKNTGKQNRNVILYFCRYSTEDNTLSAITYTKDSISENQTKNVKVGISVPKNSSEHDYRYSAFLCDSNIGGKVCCAEAQFLEYTTELYGITVAGVPVADFDNGKNEYKVKVNSSNEKIVIYPKSGTAKLTYVDYKVPGKTTVKIASGNNNIRTLNIYTYREEADMYSLTGLGYTIGNETKEILGFNPSQTNYEITLPDNTFYVKINASAIGNISYYVKDINDSPNVIGGVSFGKMRTDTTGPAYSSERLAYNAIIPIKNEKTYAIVKVANGDDKKTYTITFKCRQPRLTEFTFGEGVNDTYTPIFTSGAGLNNDNGSLTASDRIWVAANISKKLVGASYFMSPFNNQNQGWWNSDSRQAGDEYFHFTADTPGTVYLLTEAAVSNYADWENVNNGSKPNYNFELGDKSLNDYDSPEYFLANIHWSDNTARCTGLWINPVTKEEKIGKIDGSSAYARVFAKKFNAGEKVSITHTGLRGAQAARMIWAVKWDDIDLNIPTAEQPKPPIKEDGVILDYDYINNTGENILDKYSDSWKDLSANENNLDLSDISGGWTDDGLLLKTGLDDKEKAVLIDAADVFNSYNFTIEFKLGSIDDNANILASSNEKLSLCNENKKLKFYFASIARNPISVNADDAINKLNRITCSEENNKLTFKWYVDDKLLAEKTYKSYTKKNTDSIMLGSYNNKFYSGNTIIKSLKIYDYAKNN